MVKAVYKNNDDEYQKFGTFHTFIGRLKHILTFSGLFLGLGILFFVLALFGMTMFATGAVVCFLFVFLLPLLNWVMLKVRIRKLIKRNPNFDKTKNSYTFNDNDFNLIIEVNKKEEKHTIKYENLYSVYETKNNYYLYLDYLRALIITKEGITEGTANDLSNIFSKSMGKKFHSKNK